MLSSEREVDVRPFSQVELTFSALALGFATVAFFFETIAFAFAAALAAAICGALTLARILLEEIGERRLR